jgi:hypothetical protein
MGLLRSLPMQAPDAETTFSGAPFFEDCLRDTHAPRRELPLRAAATLHKSRHKLDCPMAVSPRLARREARQTLRDWLRREFQLLSFGLDRIQ